MATPKAGIGSVLIINGQTMARVKDIKGPNKTANTYDTTTHDSPNHYEEFIPGLKSGGEVTFSLLFDIDDAGHAALDTLIENATVFTWSVTPGASTASYSGSGMISKLDHTFPVNGIQAADCTIKISGPVTRG